MRLSDSLPGRATDERRRGPLMAERGPKRQRDVAEQTATSRLILEVEVISHD
jgi:hypothetical protein